MAIDERMERLISKFVDAIPHVNDGDPIKDFIDEDELFEVAEEFAKQLDIVVSD